MYKQGTPAQPSPTSSYLCPERNKPTGCEGGAPGYLPSDVPRAIADPPSLVQFDRPVLAVRLGSLPLADHVHQVAQADCGCVPWRALDHLLGWTCQYCQVYLLRIVLLWCGWWYFAHLGRSSLFLPLRSLLFFSWRQRPVRPNHTFVFLFVGFGQPFVLDWLLIFLGLIILCWSPRWDHGGVGADPSPLIHWPPKFHPAFRWRSGAMIYILDSNDDLGEYCNLCMHGVISSSSEIWQFRWQSGGLRFVERVLSACAFRGQPVKDHAV